MATEQNPQDHFYIKIQNQKLPTEALADLIEVSVDSSLHIPDMFTILLHDEDLIWIDDPIFGLGNEVEISAVPAEGGQSQVLIKGEITALEPDFNPGTQATLLVRGYDRSHRLHRGTHSQSYQQVSDSDLVQQIGQEAGLKVKAEQTAHTYDHILQHNQSHWVFLSERARLIGYDLFVDDKTLVFKPPANDSNQLELEWGHQLRRFNPRLTLAEQVDEVIVRGWDPAAQQVTIGRATRGRAEPKVGLTQNGAKLASSAFNSARRVVINRMVNNQAEADRAAQAICDELSGTFIEADGECYGQPALKAGRPVKLTKLGRRFSGEYVITASTHTYRAKMGYRTQFQISGRRAQTLYGLLVRTQTGGTHHRFSGPVTALVTNNHDPENRGRVKVTYPWLSDEVESDWIRLVSPGAGASRGLHCLPEVDDEVLVGFEQGDFNRPYVLGGLWNGQDSPPLSRTDDVVKSGKVYRRQLKTRIGHTLTFSDDNGVGITLRTAGGLVLKLDDDNKTIWLESGDGISLTAKGDLIFKGQNLRLEAESEVAIKGTKVNINNGALEVV